MFGHQLLMPVPDVDRTDFFLILGANPLASNGSLMTAPGMRAPAQGAPRARRPGRRGRPAAHRDRGARRPAPLHPARHRRAAPARACCTCSSPRGSRGPGRLARVHRRPRRASRARSRAFPPERVAAADRHRRPATIRALARDFAAAPAGRRLRPRRRLAPRSSAGSAAWLVNVAQRRHRQPRPRRAARCSRARRSTSSALGRPLGQRGHFDKRAQPRARPARVRRRVPGGGAGRGDRDAGRRARSARWSPRRQPGALDAQRRAARARAGAASTSWSRSTSTSTRPRATRTSSCRRPSPLERDHYDLVFHASPCATPPSTRRRSSRPPPDARHDWEILLELAAAARRGRGGRGLRVAAHARGAAAGSGPRGLLDLLLRVGPARRGLRPFGRGLTLRPAASARRTASTSARSSRACPAALLHARPARSRSRPRALVGGPRARCARRLDAPRERRPACSSAAATCARNNSWMHNSAAAGEGPRALHAADAPRRRGARAASPTASAVRVALARRARSRRRSRSPTTMMPGRGQPAARLGPRAGNAAVGGAGAARREPQRPHRRAARSTRSAAPPRSAVSRSRSSPF